MMTTKVRKKSGTADFFGSLLRKQIFIPIAALLLLAVFNLIADPSFYKISLGYNSAGDPVLSGYLMTILDYGSELAILAIGMTLVTAASGGQDISVGATIAISGSVILRVLCGVGHVKVLKVEKAAVLAGDEQHGPSRVAVDLALHVPAQTGAVLLDILCFHIAPPNCCGSYLLQCTVRK